MYSSDTVFVRMNVIASINVLQPVTLTALSRAMGSKVDRSLLHFVLQELTEDGLVVRERRHYRLTPFGMSFLTARQISMSRDINRMKYLLATSKQRGGDTPGR